MHPAILLADASQEAAGVLLGLTVSEWILLGSALAGAVGWALKWLDARKSKQEAHELALAKVAAETQLGAVIDGVERAADPKTKAEIKRTALERGVEGGLADVVKTRRLG